MYILGINISHHASVCLLKDGEVVFYLEEDRLSREKEAEYLTESSVEAFKKIPEYTKYLDYICFVSFGRGGLDDDCIISYCLHKLDCMGIMHRRLVVEREHHLYHAYNAFYSSNFKEAAALVLDGGGELFNNHYREAESMYVFGLEKSKCLFKHYGEQCFIPSKITLKKFIREKKVAEHPEEKNIFISSSLSCGNLFKEISCALGLFSGEIGPRPGKTMGLSAYGNTDKLTKPWYKKDEKTGVWVTDNKRIIWDLYTKYRPFYHMLRRGWEAEDWVSKYYFDLEGEDEKSKEMFRAAADVAKKLQEETKLHTIRLIQDLLDRTCTNNVVLSGGYFLNCVNNYEYIKEFPEVNFYIDPIAHDGGTAMGAARYAWQHQDMIEKDTSRHPLKTLFLG